MEIEEIKRKLQDHEERLNKLELKGRPKKQEMDVSKKTLSDHIIDLRDTDFFSEPKTAKEVNDNLKGKYHCELNRIEVALKKISDRKDLRKTSKMISEKKYKAYVW